MNDIAGIPYIRAPFEMDGRLLQQVNVPAGTTDVIVVSHGWNNNQADAEDLYSRLFTSFSQVGATNDLDGRKLAVVGVVWPSKRFDEMVASVADQQGAQGSASLNSPANAESQKLLEEKLTSMEAIFTKPEQKAAIAEMRKLIPDLEDKATARRAFIDKTRSLLDRSHADGEDASSLFFKEDGEDVMQALKIDESDLDDALTNDGGSASLPLGVGTVKPTTTSSTDGAAGFLGFLSGFKSAAMNALNFTTYYEMKSRAGTVGKTGVAPLIDALSDTVERVHLVGHSFGGRVVTSAAANTTTDKIRSMSLLQSAFSHNGFSKSMNGFFRSVVDKKRVDGPIIVTHTVNDKAVGIAYPLASRIAQQTAAALGDANDKYGGLGRNGAQKMEAAEIDPAHNKMLPSNGAYQFKTKKFFNLEASDYVKGHSDIAGKEVANAVRSAVASS
jgi:predicted alpha/beta hydrolase family esterase